MVRVDQLEACGACCVLKFLGHIAFQVFGLELTGNLELGG